MQQAFDPQRDLAAARPGQRRAIDTIMKRVRAGEKTTSIVLPTRYGKSDVMRLATAFLVWGQDACCALAIEPNITMRRQISNRTEWQDLWGRYSLPLEQLAYREIRNLERTYTANGEAFVAMTMQLFQRNIDLITPWMESLIHATGRTLLLFVDETHFLAAETGSRASNVWSQAVAQAMAIDGVHVVELTATPYRADNRTLPGFTVVEEQRKAVQFSQFRPHDDPDWVYRDDYAGETKRVKVVPDHETTFKEAWDEKPSPLAQLSRFPFDVDLTELTWTDGEQLPSSERHLLSQLTAREARKLLSRVVRDQRTIERGVRRALESLRNQRQNVGTREPRVLIFVGNDGAEGEEDERDAHARRVQHIVERVARELLHEELRVEIATGNTEDAADVIQRFVDPRQPGDVLILKQMAGLGITAPSVKTLLDLSTTRQPGACLQRWMRAATPFRNLPATLISLADVLSRQIFEDLVEGNGGGQTITDVDLLNTVELLRDEGGPLTDWLVDGVSDADFDDSEGRTAPATEQPGVIRFREVFPEVGELLTHADLAHRMRQNNFTFGEAAMAPPGPVDQGAEVARRQQDIHTLTKTIEKLLRRGAAYDRAAYQARMQRIWTSLYRIAGVPRGDTFEQISDCSVLDRIIEAATAWQARLTRSTEVDSIEPVEAVEV